VNVEEIVIGDDHDISVVVTDNAGEIIDITGDTVAFALRRFPGQDPLVDKDSTADPTYVEVTEAVLGQLTVHMPNTDTALMTPGKWIYTLKRTTAASKVYTIGQFEIWAYNDTDNWGWHDVEKYIQYNLGAGVITIELTAHQMEECIKAAVFEYSRLLPLKLSGVVTAPRWGQVDMTSLGYGRGILNVQIERESALDTGFGFSYPISMIVAGGASPGVVRPGVLEETLGYLEMARRVVGADFEWIWNAPYLYVKNVPMHSSKLFYICADNHIIQTIPTSDQEWINKFALARAKQIVGAIRGKYSGVSTPGGGTSLDGSEMKSTGAQEEQMLLEELRKKVPDEPFLWG
jgi:hypothetical protein